MSDQNASSPSFSSTAPSSSSAAPASGNASILLLSSGAVAALRAAIENGEDPRATAAWASLTAVEKLAALEALRASPPAVAVAAAAAVRKRGRPPGPASASSAAAKRAPPTFASQAALVMHAMGDAPAPLAANVALVEREAIAYAQRVFRDVRALGGAERTTTRLGDFAKRLPATTRVFFRWKTLRMLAAAKPAEVRRTAVAVVAPAIAGAALAGGAVAGEDGDAEAEADAGEGEDDDVGEDDVYDGAAVDAEEQQELARLQAEADEELRRLGGGDARPGAGAAPGGADAETAITDPSPEMQAFRRRLAFANARSRLMTTAQYDAYHRAREASFTGGARGRLSRRFAALLPPPAPTKATLEVISYLAYDRVGQLVEAAVRERSAAGAAARSAAGDVAALVADVALLEEPLPAAAYVAALASLPALPAELGEVVGELRERALKRAEEIQLREAREAQRAAAAAAERAAAAARAAREAAAAAAEAAGGAAGQSARSAVAEADAAFIASIMGALKR